MSDLTVTRPSDAVLHSTVYSVYTCIVLAAPQVCSIAAAKAGAASSPFSRQLNQNCCLAVSTVRRAGW